ncbi:mitochondrial metalloendopeptidase OMA1 [Daucus carota subsp. sativus]|nr:PREDICTED: mitochondrial metalloendopeptidase OMA1-like [Daucus carota subsp. sativus]
MLQDAKLYLFSPKLIAPKNYQTAAPTISSQPQHCLFHWYPFTSSKTLGFNQSFWSQNHHFHKLILTKFACYKNSVLRLFDSKKPGSNPAPNFSRLNRNFLVQSPSAAIGFRTLGAVRHYHKYRGPSLALKDYSKFARFMKHVKEYKVLYIVGIGIVTIFTIGSWETIPYSKRKHFVLIPPSKDTSFGNFISRTREEIFVLPQDHPDSVRVRSISNKILRALQSDLKIKEMTGLEYSSRNITSNVDEKEAAVPWWRRTKFSTRHLEGLGWEVVVVDRYLNNAYVLPGGKIVVYKYLLKSCKSDDQVAAVIGHEVGHVVARHYAERFTKALWFVIGMMIIFSGGSGRSPPPHPLGTEKLAELVLNPCSRRNEKEADYIGLLLMASAGYDPREAPKVYEMLDPPDDSSTSKFKFIRDFFSELFSTHPSGKKRIAALSKPKVMEEAMTRYSKAIEATRREEEECQCLEGEFDVCGS